MMDWLTDTFIWTAALIMLVLLIRRPVARHFGPQAAYALWALPLIRLVLPPLTLPAWMAPSEPATALATELERTLIFDVSNLRSFILNPSEPPNCPLF